MNARPGDNSASEEAAVIVRERVGYADARVAFTQALLDIAVAAAKGDKCKAASNLEIDRDTLRRRGAKNGIEASPDARAALMRMASALYGRKYTYRDALARFDREIAAAALGETGGNHVAAAKLLRVHRNTIWKMKERD